MYIVQVTSCIIHFMGLYASYIYAAILYFNMLHIWKYICILTAIRALLEPY